MYIRSPVTLASFPGRYTPARPARWLTSSYVEVGGVANIMLAALLMYQGIEAILKHLVKEQITLISILSESTVCDTNVHTSVQVDALLMHLLG